MPLGCWVRRQLHCSDATSSSAATEAGCNASVYSGVVGEDPAADGTMDRGGTAVVAAEQQPSNMQSFTNCDHSNDNDNSRDVDITDRKINKDQFVKSVMPIQGNKTLMKLRMTADLMKIFKNCPRKRKALHF